MRQEKNTRLKGITLLRALAIILIIIFHVSVKTLPGGFIGVDLFFVMSGFLAMTSMMEAYKSKSKLSILDYMVKKFKKLSPSLYIMVIGVLIFLVLFNKPVLENSNLDGLAGLTYSSNIWYIVKKVDYFASFQAKPFNHLWYLGVQFQFYIAFIILVKIFGIDREKRFDNISKAMTIIILASFLYSFFSFDIDRINRIYYGTDTRAYEFLLGALAAKVLPLTYVGYKYKYFRAYKGIISIASMALFIFLSRVLSQYSFFLYKGGFILIDILSLVMIYSTALFVRGKMTQVVDWTPLGFIGDLSYDLYIWHYPIFVLSQTPVEIDQLNIGYTILRLIATLLISILVKNFIVDPMNKPRSSKYSARRRRRYKKKTGLDKRMRLTLSILLVLLAFMGLTGRAIPYLSTAFIKDEQKLELEDSYIAQANKDDPNETKVDEEKPEEEVDEKVDEKEDPKDKDEYTDPKTPGNGQVDDKKDQQGKDEPKKDPVDLSLEENIKQMRYDQIVLIGDSLSVNVGPAVKEAFDKTIADGKVSRQLYNSYDVVRQYVSYDGEDTALIFLLGSNGVFLESHMEELISPFELADVYFVNIQVPGNYEDQVNSTLKSFADKHKDRVFVIDWNERSKDHPEYFAPDKVHLQGVGIDAMVKLIFEDLNRN
ncbi:MAG: acyltransferase family protein [Tissierellia bacterium]|nr:acyltransferase family protein [Tissierellia bacterium]